MVCVGLALAQTFFDHTRQQNLVSHIRQSDSKSAMRDAIRAHAEMLQEYQAAKATLAHTESAHRQTTAWPEALGYSCVLGRCHAFEDVMPHLNTIPAVHEYVSAALEVEQLHLALELSLNGLQGLIHCLERDGEFRLIDELHDFLEGCSQ
ncbi:hypothetical protein NMY22_g2434 [Coprinellus aureogranulatus]|nr:hypothetical protein NMY22_g2434 [Coprinellus aureogranulatus]